MAPSRSLARSLTAVLVAGGMAVAALVGAPAASAAIPDVPTGLTATRAATGTSVTYAWAASAGAPVTYTVTEWTAQTGGTVVGTACTATAPAITCNGTVTRTASSWVTVSATNADGTSADSATVAVPALPSVPAGVTPVAASGMLAVSWSASTSSGNPVTSYRAIASQGGIEVSRCVVAVTSCDIVGLTNGQTYDVEVNAGNADGWSDSQGVLATGTPIAIPSAPTTVAGTGDVDSVTVTWAVPTTDGGSAITAYTASAYAAGSGGAAVTTCNPATLTSFRCSLTGLTNGTTYYVTVSATNANGTGPEAVRYAVKAGTLSGSPTSVTASRVDGGVLISWSAPSSSGSSPITGYTASVYAASSGGSAVASCTATGTECTATGLTNATTYYVSVTATTVVGDSTPSSRVTSAGVGTLSEPRAVKVERGNGFVRVSWTAPSSTGNSRILDYTARAYSTATGTKVVASCTVSVLVCVMGPVPNGTEIYVDVVARNALTTGPASSPRVAMIPGNRATEPRAVTAVDQGGAVKVTWQVPVADGGLPITSYEAKAWSSKSGGTERGKCTTSGDSCVISNLVGAPVYVDVTPITAVGTGTTSSPRIRVVLMPVAGAVQVVSVAPRHRKAEVSWFAPARVGTSPVKSYVARVLVGTNVVGTCTAEPTKNQADRMACMVRGLPVIKDSATVEVSAIGTDGVATPNQVTVPWKSKSPTFPRQVQALSGEDQLTIAWQAPASDGGSPVRSYRVHAFDKPDGTKAVAMCTAKQDDESMWQSCVLTGLLQFEPYYVRVSAVNENERSGYTKAVTEEAKPVPPSAPSYIALYHLDTGVKVVWGKPLSDGGYPVQQYIAEAWSEQTGGDKVGSCVISLKDTADVPKGLTAVRTDTCDITGSSDGAFIWVDVYAENTVGPGAPTARVPYTILDTGGS